MEPVRFAETLIALLVDDEIFIIDSALDVPIDAAVFTLTKTLALMPRGDEVAVALTNGDTILVYRKSCKDKYQEFITEICERNHADVK